MNRKPRTYKPDRVAAEWNAKFSGYTVYAWGKRQVLNAPIEIWVRREAVNPNVWCARAYPGDHAPAAIAATAEECMRAVRLQFVKQLEPWIEYRWQGLGKCQLKSWNVVEMADRTAD